MPTIHAAGWPISAHESVAARRSAGTHSPAASVPAVVRIATPAPTGIWAVASRPMPGAAALASEPSASSERAGEKQPGERHPRAETAEGECRDPGDEPRHGAKLAGYHCRYAEIASDADEDGRERDRARLSRERQRNRTAATVLCPRLPSNPRRRHSGERSLVAGRRPVARAFAAEWAFPASRATSAAASTNRAPTRNARWKPAVRAKRRLATRAEDGGGAVGRDRRQDGEPERAAELHRGVQQPGGDAGLVGRDAVGGGGGDAGEDSTRSERDDCDSGQQVGEEGAVHGHVGEEVEAAGGDERAGDDHRLRADARHERRGDPGRDHEAAGQRQVGEAGVGGE